MRRHQLQAEPLTMHSWRKTVHCFKPKAARGPDGFDKKEMKFVPDSYLEQVLSMFQAIEDTDVEWPQQLLLGLVIGLAKHDLAHEESHFRPINLFSMWYRAWARLRTKEMIQQLSSLMPPEILASSRDN